MWNTFGFQLSPVVWYSTMYFLNSSSSPMNARTHSTCFVFLENKILVSKWGRVTSLDPLLLVFLDNSIPIKLCLLFDILDERAWFGLLKGL